MAQYLATTEQAGTGAIMTVNIDFKGVDPDVGSGSTPYINRADVKAAVVTKATQTAPESSVPMGITYVGPTTFRTNSAVAVGKVLRVYRDTQDEYGLVQFQALQTVTELDLDLNARQMLYVAMETRDAATRAEETAGYSDNLARVAIEVANQAGQTAAQAVVTAGAARDRADQAVNTASYAVQVAVEAEQVSQDALDGVQGSVDAANAATQAAQEATAAASQAVTEAEAYVDNATARFLSASTSAPATRDNGTPLQLGDRYLNTGDGVEYIYKMSGWAPNNLDGAALAGSNGAGLVGYGSTTVAAALRRTVWLEDFPGYVGDGVADDTSALEAAVASGAKVINWSRPYLRITRTVTVPQGTFIVGKSQRLSYFFMDLAGGSVDGIVFQDPTAGFNFVSGVCQCTIMAPNGGGRYAVRTPSSTGAWMRRCHYYFTDVAATDKNTSLTFSSNYWECIFQVGDCNGVTLQNFHLWGGHAPTNTTDATTSTAFRTKATVGAIMVNISNGSATSFSKGIDLSDGTEGFRIDNVELVNVWKGVVGSNIGGEPGGFINNLHINTNYRGLELSNRVEMNIVGLSVYQSSDFAAHSLGWAAVEWINCGFKGTLSNLNVVPGDPVNRGGGSVFKGTNCAFNSMIISDVNVSGPIDSTFSLDGVSGLSAHHIYSRGSTRFASITSVSRAASDLHFDQIDCSASDGNLMVIGAGAVTSTITCKRTPGGSNNQPVRPTLTAGTAVTLAPKVEFAVVAVSGSTSGNADLILSRSGATAGDVVEIKLVHTSNTAVVFRLFDSSTSGTLMTSKTGGLAAAGGSKRYYIKARYSGASWEIVSVHVDSTTES